LSSVSGFFSIPKSTAYGVGFRFLFPITHGIGFQPGINFIFGKEK